MSPTTLSLRRLRQLGYTTDVCERWIARIGVRRDLFHCIDVVAICGRERGVLGIQATTGANVSARVKKAQSLPALRTWLEAGNRFEVWGWSKRGNRWRVRIVAIRNPADLATETLEAPARRRGGRRPQQAELF